MNSAYPDSTFTINYQRKAGYASTQRSTLDTIAAACPYEYGPGVYMARAMLSVADTTIYDYVNACENGPVPATAISGRILVFPNPTTGQVTIVLPEVPENPWSYSLTGVAGKETEQGLLKARQQVLQFDGLSSGLYYLRIFKGSEQRHAQKLVIIDR